MATEIRMPQISMTMIDGTIVKWLKKEGDPVAEGEALVEIQTDKVVETLTAAASGIVLSIAAKEDETIPVGGVICCIAAEGESAPATASSEKAEPSLSAPSSPGVPEITMPQKSGGRASPLAKKIAAQKGVALSHLTGTGPGGLIVKADVESFNSTASSAAGQVMSQAPGMPPIQAAEEDTVVPFAGIRKTIADNLMASKRAAADVTTVADVDMGAVKEMRSVLPVSYTAFCLKAAAKALEEYPVMNALVEDERVIMKKRINLSVAVATNMGLLTPVIPDAGTKNLLSISDDLTDLSERGRDGKLTARDFEGGTFTVTNSGVFGSIVFTPIINHPQSAVLGLGRIAKVPVVKEDDTIAPALMMYMSLTYNHRSIDGETAVKFLQRVRYYLEHPAEMLGLKKPGK
ncbi:MAG: Dihydrolipoyllysine-residue succinyltransferase component of 2-oxoglutarate dehydrogenase complex [Desulfovibrio sp.]